MRAEWDPLLREQMDTIIGRDRIEDGRIEDGQAQDSQNEDDQLGKERVD